jgi:DNA-binding transcriptional LysR family regulator
MLGMVAAGAGVALVPAAARKIEPRRVVYKLPHPSALNLETAIAWRREDRPPVLTEFIGVARRTLPGRAYGAARTGLTALALTPVPGRRLCDEMLRK